MQKDNVKKMTSANLRSKFSCDLGHLTVEVLGRAEGEK